MACVCPHIIYLPLATYAFMHNVHKKRNKIFTVMLKEAFKVSHAGGRQLTVVRSMGVFPLLLVMVYRAP